MKSPGRPRAISRESHLHQLLTNHFHDPDQAFALIDEFLRHETYDMAFVCDWIALAKKEPTRLGPRRLAALMLEHQILKLDPNER